MDPFYNSNNGYNPNHRPPSSNQHLNPNLQGRNNVQSVQPGVPPNMAGQNSVVGAPGMQGYNASYAPQNNANNAQYRMAAAAAAAGRSMQPQQGVYGQQQAVTGMQQQQQVQQRQNVQQNTFASPSRQPQMMYNPRAPAAPGMASPAAAAAQYGNTVPNPLGLGGAPAPVGGSVVVGGASPATMGQSKKDLLRSMYQSRNTQAAPSSRQPQQQQQVQGGMQANYRPAGIQQQQQQGLQQQQQRPAANSAYGTVPTMQSSNTGYRQQGNTMPQQQPQQNVQRQGIQTGYHQQQQQNRQQTSQVTTHAQLMQQQRQMNTSQTIQPQTNIQQRQQVQQVNQQQVYQQQQQQQQQQQPTNRMNIQQQQFSQQSSRQPQQIQQNQTQSMISPLQSNQSRQASSQQPQQQQPQQSHHSSRSSHSSSHQSSSSSSNPQEQRKHRFHLTPAAKLALREAVLSAIRHPEGLVDPGCLQRAMAQGLPEKAINNAAQVARARDKKNREERNRQAQAQAQQQRGGQVQQQSGQQQQRAVQLQQQGQIQQQRGGQVQGMQQGQQGMQQQRSSTQSMSQQRQPQQVHQAGMSRTTQQSYQQQGNTTTSAKSQMQQLYSNQQQSNGNAMQYNQGTQQNQQNRIYQQQQQAQQQAQQQRQQQQQQAQQKQQQQAQYQRQLQAQQAQKRRQEEARKKQLQQQYHAEQKRRILEEERKQKEMEAAKRAQQAAEEARRRNAELVGKMQVWGRTAHGLVVKGSAQGLPANIQQAANASRLCMRQSPWGGAAMCLDGSPALVGALKRSKKKKKGLDVGSSSTKQHPDHVKRAVDMIRKQLLMKPQPMLKENAEPYTEAELRHQRTLAISSKLLESQHSHTTMKRLKLQPKRESKFLDRHIKRARQMTADSHSKRHKELLKAIVTHQSEFYKFHRIKKNECAKLARSIRDQHRKAEVAKEKEAESAEKARIAALRSNDMAAYTSLLEDTKNDRLKYLLDKTDECMNQISTLLATRVAEEEEDIKMMGGEGTIQATFTQDVTGGSYYETAHVKSEQVRQPSILVGGDLKEYQLSGLQWMVSLYNNRLNGILADEMGLGKTIQTIALIAYLIEVKQNLGPYLVIVPLSTLSNWVNEFAKWLPAATVVCYKGSPQQRKALFRDEVADGHFNVLLTTYEFVIRDKGSLRKIAWQYAIVDEGHRMKNNQSKFAVTLSKDYNTRRRVLLTGTPLQNNLPELWALLNFLLPAIFNSAETFDDWFNKPFASFGKTGSSTGENADDSSNDLLSNEERMLVIHRLHELLRPFMLRRVKSEVLDQLPEKVEKVIRCELSSWQKELYKQISHKIAGEAQTKNFNRGLNNVVMQLRKVCNHPYLFTQDGYHINEDIIRTSGKVELLDRMLPKLKAAGHRVLMFTQMTKMMPILEDYFAYRGFSSLRLDGSTSADEREKRMYMFNAPDSPYFIFLLSTRAGGLGLNLATADTVIIFDSDWNPMMDLQAQDRAHRIGQRKDVRVFRIITQTPVEEKILSRATEKLQMNELVVEAGKFDKSGQGKEDNSLERLKMMELLLTDFDQNVAGQGTATSEEDFENDTNVGEEEETKDLLNEMISSNDDDYKLYCKMDLERTNAPALYSDVADCPDWVLYPKGKPEEGDIVDDGQPEILGKRRAAAGDIKYDDGLTEKQFCRLMDKQSIAEEKGKKKGKGKKRKNNSLDTSLILENDGGGRKRSKTNHPELEDTSSRSQAGTSSAGGYGNGEVTAAINDRLTSVTKSIIYFKDKNSKRKLSEIFLEKPCPQTYPDYYQIIDKPIGMNDILRKCRAKLYATVNDYRDDWKTLFRNALTYNGEGSWIVMDAEVLRGELDKLMDKNGLNGDAAGSKKPVRIKLSLKKPKKKKKGSKSGDSDANGASTPDAAMNKSESQSSKSVDSDNSDANTDDYSNIVGMGEREASLYKRRR